MIEYNYNPADKKSIKAQGLKMLNKSLRDVLPPEQCLAIEDSFNVNNKGAFGNIIEKYIFNKKPDNISGPDFPEAGVELKTTPIKRHREYGYSAKERLVFSMINYKDVVKETWETSSFLKKNNLLLLMMYFYENQLPLLDYKFKIIELIDLLENISQQDIQTIRDDWNFIVNKIREGKAHELSEGDTYYLGACTKGKDSSSKVNQPNSKEMAMSRAFSLKQKYLNFIIATAIKSQKFQEDYDSIRELKAMKTIEQSVMDRFEPFIGLTTDEIHSKCNLPSNKPKDYYAILARAMLGVRRKKIEEFDKADITMKTIRLSKSGTPEESMSFPAIDYINIVNEEWETSTFREYLSRKKFLFVIYQYDNNGKLFLKKVRFWNIPYSDLEGNVKKVWSETVKRIKAGCADDLPKISFNSVCHVRPHGRNKSDTKPTPYGVVVMKQSFWLNSKYIRQQLED